MCLPLKAFANISSFLPRPLSPIPCSRTEEGLLLWWTSQATESDGSLPEGRPQVRTYSDYLRAAREAEKEDSIELSRGSRFQIANGLSKPKTASFFPLRKLKGHQPLSKKPAIHLAQLEEEDADDGNDPQSDDPNGLEGVMEEFMV